MRKPDWTFWRAMPRVELWQAVALSIGLNPDKVQQTTYSDGWLPFSYPGCVLLLSDGYKQHLNKRLRLLKAHCVDGGYFGPGDPRQVAAGFHQITLSKFSAWCSTQDWNIPPELAALAKNKRPPNDAPLPSKVEPDREDEPAKLWQDAAREIADEFDRRDMAVPCHDSVRHLAERVADSLREKKVFGPRGPLSAASVLRGALQGDLWNNRRPNRGKTG